MSQQTVYRKFRDMIWPAPGESMRQIEWRLRYAPDSITIEDKLQIASVLSAYRDLVFLPQRTRNDYVMELRQGPNIPSRHATSTPKGDSTGEQHG